MSTFINLLVIWPDPTHPPTHQTMHPPIGGRFSTKFKSSNRIELSSLVQVLLNFWLIPGVPPLGVGRWVDWVGGGCWYVEGCTMHTHAHACMHVCMHTLTCMLNMINMGASMLVAICNFYTCIHVCVCMHMCVHICRDIPHAQGCLQPPPKHLPPPQSCRESKTPKFNKSWTSQDILILFEDSLPLNIPELI